MSDMKLKVENMSRLQIVKYENACKATLLKYCEIKLKTIRNE